MTEIDGQPIIGRKAGPLSNSIVFDNLEDRWRSVLLWILSFHFMNSKKAWFDSINAMRSNSDYGIEIRRGPKSKDQVHERQILLEVSGLPPLFAKKQCWKGIQGVVH